MSDPRVIARAAVDLLGGDLLRSTTPTGERTDPYLGFRFRVEVDGLEVGGFSEAGGLDVQIDVMSYREGGENLFEYKLPGPASYPRNLTLKHGLTDVDVFLDWMQQTARGLIVRRNLTLSLLNLQGETAMLWDCRHAFPVRWSGPEFNAGSATAAFDTLELSHHGIARSNGFSLIAAAQAPRETGKR